MYVYHRYIYIYIYICICICISKCLSLSSPVNLIVFIVDMSNPFSPYYIHIMGVKTDFDRDCQFFVLVLFVGSGIRRGKLKIRDQFWYNLLPYLLVNPIKYERCWRH